MALDTLRENKVRSFLTVLGVVIGITALITVSSILVGFYSDVTAYLEDFGPNTIWVFKIAPGVSTGRLTAEERNRKPLTFEDGLAIREQCPAVAQVSVSVFKRVYDYNRLAIITARYKDKEVSGLDYSGGTVEYEEVYNAHPYVGRFFTEAENLHRADVTVIGYDLGKTFFEGRDPIDRTIYVEGFPYRVIGVLDHRKGQLFQNPRVENQVIVPYLTYRKHHPTDDEHFVGAVAAPGRMAEAQAVDSDGSGGSIQTNHGFGRHAYRRGQLDRIAGGRGRGDEYHAHVGHPAHTRNRREKSDWRAPQRCYLAIPDGGGRPYGRRRRHWRGAGHWHQPAHQSVSAQTSFHGSALGCGLGCRGFHGRWSFLRHVSGSQSRSARSC
jgi:hypothetical protein